MPNPSALDILDLGLAPYGDALRRQHDLVERRQRSLIPDTVLVLEHPPVITLGARHTANRLSTSADELTRLGIAVATVRRGGGVTAHNPGQVVFYPVLDLRPRGLGITEYVRTLEQIGIDLLAGLEVRSGRRKGLPGLWVADRKIASVGVRVSKGVTHHGMAVNISNDLTIFRHMVPCGLEGVSMTSVLDLTRGAPAMASVKQRLAALLRETFGTT